MGVRGWEPKGGGGWKRAGPLELIRPSLSSGTILEGDRFISPIYPSSGLPKGGRNENPRPFPIPCPPHAVLRRKPSLYFKTLKHMEDVFDHINSEY